MKRLVETERQRLDEAAKAICTRAPDDLKSLTAYQEQFKSIVKGRIADAKKRFEDARARSSPDRLPLQQEFVGLGILSSAIETDNPAAIGMFTRHKDALVYIIAESVARTSPGFGEVEVPLAHAEGTGTILTADGVIATTKRIAQPVKFDPRGLALASKLAYTQASLESRFAVYVAGGDGSIHQVDGPVVLVRAQPDELEEVGTSVDLPDLVELDQKHRSALVRLHLGGAAGGSSAALLRVKGAQGLAPWPLGDAAQSVGGAIAFGYVRQGPKPAPGGLVGSYVPGFLGAKSLGADAPRSWLPAGYEGCPLVSAAADEPVIGICGGDAGGGFVALHLPDPGRGEPSGKTRDPKDAPEDTPSTALCLPSKIHRLDGFSDPENCPFERLPEPTRVTTTAVELRAEDQGVLKLISSRVERRKHGNGSTEVRALAVVELGEKAPPGALVGAVIVRKHVSDPGIEVDPRRDTEIQLLKVDGEPVEAWPATGAALAAIQEKLKPAAKLSIAVPDAGLEAELVRIVVVPAAKVAEAAEKLKAGK